MLATVQMTKSVHAVTFLDNPNLVFVFDLLVFSDIANSELSTLKCNWQQIVTSDHCD